MVDVTKSEGEAGNFPASDYAYVPDPEKSSTWKLRLTTTPGGAPDTAIIGAAVAALGAGFRGNKVAIPDADLVGVKAKVRSAWMKAHPDAKLVDVPESIKAGELPDEMKVQAIKMWLKANPDKTEADAPANLQAGEPSSSDVHTDGTIEPTGGAPAPGSKRKVNRYGSKLLSMIRGSGKIPEDQLATMMAQARGHAGGKGKAANTASETHRLVLPFEFAENIEGEPDWIPYLPTPGTYVHPRWGEIDMTADRNKRFAANFKAGIYQNPIPVDGEHDTKLSGAMGWIRDMRLNENGSVDAKVDWTDRGTAMLAKERYKFISPEWYDEWTEPATGKTYNDIAIGCAMTTRPFFKAKSLRPLAAGECDDDPEGQEDVDDLSDCIFDMVYDGLTDQEITDLVSISIRLGRSSMTAYGRAMGPAGINDQPQGMGMTESQGGRNVADETKTPELKAATEGTPANTDPKAMSENELRSFVERQMAENMRLTEEAKTAAEDSKKLSERLALVETASRAKRFNDEVLGRSEENGTRWYGEADKHLKMLDKLAVTFGEDSEEVKSYVELNRSHAKQLNESGIFSVAGVGGAGNGDGSAWGRIQALAKTAREADPKLSEADAISKVASENGELYTQYQTENRAK